METGRQKRVNLRLIIIGIVPPLILMSVAYFLNDLWTQFHESAILTALIIASASIFVVIVAKEIYVPWVFRDRNKIGDRILKSLSVLLIAATFLSGYKDVGIALTIIGIVIFIKEWGKKEAKPIDDETSWYYVGEGADEKPDRISTDGSDPFIVLEISKNASPDEIKTAYRRIIKECHPDSNGGVGDTARFRRATEAYERLME
jgi:hypothetical protein